MKNAVWPNLFRGWNRTESDTVYTLRQVPVFKGFSNKEFNELEKLVHHRNYSSDDFVFKNRAPGEGMYIIMNGTIKITIGTRAGDENILANLKEGDFFGELALFDDEPRSANAISIEDSKLIGFSQLIYFHFKKGIQKWLIRFFSILVVCLAKDLEVLIVYS